MNACIKNEDFQDVLHVNHLMHVLTFYCLALLGRKANLPNSKQINMQIKNSQKKFNWVNSVKWNLWVHRKVKLKKKEKAKANK